MPNSILITGAAGFIGFHLVESLLNDKTWTITGIDNISSYYDINLKYARLNHSGINCDLIEYNKEIESKKNDRYTFIKLDLTDKSNLLKLFEKNHFDYVINLAAQAGVRYSLKHPQSYIDSNITGFLNVLECCRFYPIKHLIFASSSSVYGANIKVPFSEEDRVDYPVSLYAATKKSNELMAHSYSHLFNIPITGLRFFTVYGPWGRPDMAYYKFAQKIIKEEPIEVYNFGKMKRDFTYIDDIIAGVIELMNIIPGKLNHNIYNSKAKYQLYNLGNNNPEELESLISLLEKYLDKKAIKKYLRLQPGDVEETYADMGKYSNDVKIKFGTSLDSGLFNFVTWFKSYKYLENYDKE